MICPKCKKEVNNKMSICPRCGSALEAQKTLKSVKTVKGAKSKIDEEDKSSLVGGVVSKDSFIKLSRKSTKKKILN